MKTYYRFDTSKNISGHENILKVTFIKFRVEEDVYKCKAYEYFRLRRSRHCGIKTICIGETSVCNGTRCNKIIIYSNTLNLTFYVRMFNASYGLKLNLLKM
jgi:hypothetical protein